MPRVTRLAPEKGDRERYRVELDGERVGVLPADAVRELGLSAGTELSPDAARRVRDAADRQEALDTALHYLSFRPRSRAEVERRLRRDDLSAAAVEQALDRCEELGYLDDVEFAASHARDRIRRKPRGKLRLRMELREKGVADAHADAGIQRAFREEGVTERELLERAARKKWRKVRGEDPDRARRRFVGYLKRRGFAFDLIRQVTDRWFGAPGEEPPGPPDDGPPGPP